VCLVDVPDAEVRTMLAERRIAFSEEPRPDSDLIMLGAERIDDLDRLEDLQAFLKRDGAIWVIAPKGGREPKEADVLAAGKRAGLSTRRSFASPPRTRRTSSWSPWPDADMEARSGFEPL
jgi:hypothetical protein